MKLILLTFLFSATFALSQQRIGFDLNYRQIGLNASVSFHKVFATNWLVSGAFSFGGKGRYTADYRDYPDQVTFASPWKKVNHPSSEENLDYHLKQYNVENRIISGQVGIGYFYNFDLKHGIRGHVFAQYGQAFNKTFSYYLDAKERLMNRSALNQHAIAAVSVELYHTIHLWKKFTFFYGLKTPYYFKIDKTRFNSVRKDDNFYGIEPELSLGITYLIGDC